MWHERAVKCDGHTKGGVRLTEVGEHQDGTAASVRYGENAPGADERGFDKEGPGWHDL